MADQNDNNGGGNRGGNNRGNRGNRGAAFSNEAFEELGAMLAKAADPNKVAAAYLISRGKSSAAEVQAFAFLLRVLNEKTALPPAFKAFAEGLVQTGTTLLEFQIGELMKLPEGERAAAVSRILSDAKGSFASATHAVHDAVRPRSVGEEKDGVNLYGFVARMPPGREKDRMEDNMLILMTRHKDAFETIVLLQARPGFLDRLRARVTGFNENHVIKSNPADPSTWINVGEALMVKGLEDLLLEEREAYEKEQAHKAMSPFDHMAKAFGGAFKGAKKFGGQLDDAIKKHVPPPASTPTAGLPASTSTGYDPGSFADDWDRFKYGK